MMPTHRPRADAPPTVLLAAPVTSGFAQRLAELYAVVGPLPGTWPGSLHSLASQVRADVRALLTIGIVPVSDAELAALPSLGLVACFGSGYEGVDRAGAQRRGIAVTHSPAANASSVADLAIALTIECVRGLPAARRRLLEGAWRGNAKERQTPMPGLTGRKLGIYGLGAIGTKIAQRAVALEMDVGYHNRRRRDDVPYAYLADLHALAQWCDVLMISVRADSTNRHAVDANVLDALGPEGYVVNIARGSVVDENALIAALDAGRIAGAGLDVFEHEPDVPSALLAHNNVAVTPHVGGNTTQARDAMERMVLANLEAFFSSRPLRNPVPMP